MSALPSCNALMIEEVFVWPPKEFYPDGKCLWRLKEAMYEMRQAPRLWQEHFAETMTTKLGFRRCKSAPNLYCHESGQLYVLAYVDDLLVVVGTDEMRKCTLSLEDDCDIMVIRLTFACHRSTLIRFWVCVQWKMPSLWQRLCDERVESGCDCPDNAECRKMQTSINIALLIGTVVSACGWQLRR